MSLGVILGSFCAGLSLLGGCESAPVRRELTREEIQRVDRHLGEELSARLEKRIELVREVDAQIYLRSLTAKLSLKSAQLSDSPVGVILYRRGKEGTPSEPLMFSTPGTRVYASVEYLKQVGFENELAAALALELAHVSLRHLAQRMESSTEGELAPQKKPEEAREAETLEAFASVGVFRFNRAETEDAIGVAVDLLYKSGYDPRGLVEYWKRCKEASLTYLPNVDELIRETYRSIARYTPLRNPVVRSKDFIAFKQRIART